MGTHIFVVREVLIPYRLVSKHKKQNRVFMKIQPFLKIVSEEKSLNLRYPFFIIQFFADMTPVNLFYYFYILKFARSKKKVDNTSIGSLYQNVSASYNYILLILT